MIAKSGVNDKTRFLNQSNEETEEHIFYLAHIRC